MRGRSLLEQGVHGCGLLGLNRVEIYLHLLQGKNYIDGTHAILIDHFYRLNYVSKLEDLKDAGTIQDTASETSLVDLPSY